MYHLFSPHSFCIVMFVWCTVVYAHGRTYIDVSFSCLYGVPLVYARGRTHMDRAFTWCTIYFLHIHSVSSCLYGVPLCTHTVVLTLTCPSLVCMVYRYCTHAVVLTLIGLLRGVPFMFSTLILCRLVCMMYRCVRTRSHLHWRVLLLFVWCTVSVRTRSCSHG